MDKKIGYIFNKCEIIYISKIMGASYLFNTDLKVDITSGEIIKNAEKSLTDKNYVFRNFSGDLILNREIIDYFRPLVNPSSVIACRKRSAEAEAEVNYYISGEAYVSMEKDFSHKENYILTHNPNCNEILNDILSFAENDFDIKGTNYKFILSANQYRIMKDVVKKGNSKAIKSFMFDFNINEKLEGEIKTIFADKADILSFSFWSDYKNKPEKIDYLLYYFTQSNIWSIISDRQSNGSVRISSIEADKIYNDISDILESKFKISSDERQKLFI